MVGAAPAEVSSIFVVRLRWLPGSPPRPAWLAIFRHPLITATCFEPLRAVAGVGDIGGVNVIDCAGVMAVNCVGVFSVVTAVGCAGVITGVVAVDCVGEISVVNAVDRAGVIPVDDVGSAGAIGDGEPCS